MLGLLVKTVVLTAVLMGATLVFAEEIVVSALILLTVAFGTVALLIDREDRIPDPEAEVAVADD